MSDEPPQSSQKKTPQSQQLQKPRSPSPQAQKALSWQQQVQSLSQEIANQCKLKKKLPAKFYKYMDEATKLWETRDKSPTQQDFLLLAGLYKNLGKLGEQEEVLEKALELLKKGGGGPPGTSIRWTLQLTALKSSSQKHEQCFQLAVRAIAQAKQLLKSFKSWGDVKRDESSFAEVALFLAEEETKDEVLWRHNQKSLQKHLLSQLGRITPESLPLPFFPDAQFHISDVMALQSCKVGWESRQANYLQEIVAFLSIGYFTMATQKYYGQDYSFKSCHIKALKIALVAFDVSCAYVGFLVKILQQHFGQRLQAITQEQSVNGQHNELARLMPKESKEVSLKFLQFCDE